MEIKIIVQASTKLERFFIGWGVSFFVDDDVLFDTFSNPKALKRNLKKQNIRIGDIKYIVISHEHWDHTGGLWYLLKKNPGVHVFVCPGFSSSFKEKVQSFGVKIVSSEKFGRIKENIFTTGEISGEYKNKQMPEQAVVVRTAKGITVISGCAHPGIVGMLKIVKKRFPSEKLYLVFGGFHLMNETKQKVQNIVDEFKKMGITKVGPAHCTGKEAETVFYKNYGENFVSIKTGRKIEI